MQLTDFLNDHAVQTAMIGQEETMNELYTFVRIFVFDVGVMRFTKGSVVASFCSLFFLRSSYAFITSGVGPSANPQERRSDSREYFRARGEAYNGFIDDRATN